MKTRIIAIVSVLICASLSGYAQKVSRLNSTTIQVDLDGGKQMYLDFYSPKIVRVFYDPQGGIIRNPESNPPAQILVDNPRTSVGTIAVDGTSVSTSMMTLNVGKEGNLTVKSGTRSVIDNLSFDFSDKSKVTLSYKSSPSEYFYGGGCQNGRFSHKGQEIAIENTNNWVDGGVSSPVPFFWSTGGYGMMFYTFAPGRYDFGKTSKDEVRLTHNTSYLDVFLMVDDSRTGLLNHYYQLTGNPLLLPKYGFYQGHLNAYNRDYWKESEDGILFEDGKRYSESQKDNGGVKETLNGENGSYQFSARGVIDRYLDNDYPLGWILPNDGYATGYGQTSTLEGNVQNLKEFGEYARSRGVQIGLWTQSDLHPKEGIEPLLQRDIIREVRDGGVRVLKTDVAWVGAGYSFGLNGVSDIAQVMTYYGNEARPFIISVDGWAGTQRYAGIWTGDQTGGQWEYIRFHIPSYIGCGLSGMPNATSDTDGIFGGKNIPVNIREFQWKTFTPMQLNMDGWGSSRKYPQAQGETAAKINRWYLKLKSRLLPYSYSVAHDAITGKPIMRAMMLEEENPYTLGIRTQYQFMYGPSILVAPIYQNTAADEDGNDIRNGIYLPKGNWIDYFTGESFAGSRILNDFNAPIWKLPVFIKEGAIIPMHKSTRNPSEIDSHFRSYDIYPGADNEFCEYDDDGMTQSYLNKECVTNQIKIAMQPKGCEIHVGKVSGTYNGFEPMKSTLLRVYMMNEPKKFTVRINNKKVKLTKVDDYKSMTQTPNSYYYGTTDDEYMAIRGLMINLEQMDICNHDISINIETEQPYFNSGMLLKTHGELARPVAADSEAGAYDIKLKWEEVANADYYELMFDGQTYSTIRQHTYTIDGLTPHSDYAIKVRAVNADGTGEWTDMNVSTIEDPLKDAVRGIRGETSCENQGGQQVEKLFDFDLGSTWHTKWGQNAVPFTLTMDLRSVNQLDKIQYVPRTDAGNGTLLKGTVEISMDNQNWTSAGEFNWARNSQTKEFALNATARYIRFNVTEGVGGFGSGQQIYVFRKPNSEWYIQGDLNRDGRLDENDLTSFMNYNGLRKGDSDFEGYISQGDINGNGLIDAYDISAATIEMENGVSRKPVPAVSGTLQIAADRQNYNVGDTITLTVSGKALKSVNALSLCIPYDVNKMEYAGMDADACIAGMYDLTRDRLHSNGMKALYPTFANIGEKKPLGGDVTVMKIRFVAKQVMKFKPEMTDVMLVDKKMRTTK